MNRPQRRAPLKRLVDLVGAIMGLIVFSPILAIVAVLIRAQLGAPILFRQQRPGLNGEPFWMVKFRTMRSDTTGDGRSLDDSERMTPLGTVLRAWSIDELPELWNVFRGEMSLVGPRPLLMEYLPLYTPEQARRHEVRPGLTGLAQVSGRNSLTWREKFTLDVKYVDDRSMRMDMNIIMMTIIKVFRREAISASGHATMPAFTGSAEDHLQ